MVAEYQETIRPGRLDRPSRKPLAHQREHPRIQFIFHLAIVTISMKARVFSALLSAVLFTGTAVLPMPAHAETTPQEIDAVLQKRIAFVDMQQLFRASKAGQSIQQQLGGQQKIYQDKVTQANALLKQAEEQLGRQRTVLSPEAYAQKRQEFEQQIASAQRDLQTRKQNLDYAFSKAMEQLQNSVGGIIATMAEKEGLMLVLPRAQVVLAQKSLDITPRVLTQLDQQVQTIKVDVNATAPAGAGVMPGQPQAGQK
jgi:outer membrane protein